MMTKKIIEVIPGSYPTEDGAINESESVYGAQQLGVSVPQMSQSFINTPIEIPSTSDTVNILVGQNAKKDNENVRLNDENEQLSRRNKALEERLKKMGQDCRIMDYDGRLSLRQNLYEAPVYLAGRIIDSVVMIHLDTEKRMEFYYLLMSEESPKGQLLIKGRDLYTDRLVDAMKKYLESPLNAEGHVKKTKMKDLVTEYLLGKIDRNQESIVLHKLAGWHGKKWFSADFKDENTIRLLRAEFPELPMMKRQWKIENRIGMLPELDSEDECAYFSIMVGAVCLSLFHDAGIRYTPVAWIENTPKNRIFLQNYCIFWQNYIETAEADTAYNKRSILEAFRSAKDETVLILSGNGKNKRCKYIDELLESAYYGYPYRQKVEIMAVPIIVSEEFNSYVDGAEQEMPIFPILFGDKFSGSNFCIGNFLYNLVNWMEQNYKEILEVISFVKGKRGSDMRAFLYGVHCICWLYQNQIPSASFCLGLKQIGYQEVEETIEKMIAKYEAFLRQDSLEFIRSALFKSQANHVLVIESINVVIEEEDFNRKAYLLYDTDGTCYIKYEFFCQMVEKNSGIPPKILLKKLSVDGVIQSIQNGNGRTTNSCNVKLHFREREKAVKMIRFFPGKLMNSEGAAFGGELL